jgi:hypothetical protein
MLDQTRRRNLLSINPRSVIKSNARRAIKIVIEIRKRLNAARFEREMQI